GDTAPSRKERTARPKSVAFARVPAEVRPMLATLTAEPFDRPGCVFEVKWDGYRAIAHVEEGTVRLLSRTGQDFTRRFPPIVEALKNLKHDAVLDGEVVVVDNDGRSHFQLLQNYQKTGRGNLVYYVFDLLALDGVDLRDLPLVERKKKLGKLVAGLSMVRLSEHIEEKGIAFFRATQAKGLEGMIAKDGKSRYQSGARSRDWLKVKTHLRQEAVVGGFTEPRGRRKKLGSLLLGVYEATKLVYIGHTGGGLSSEQLADLRSRLDPLERKDSPFQVKPR